ESLPNFAGLPILSACPGKALSATPRKLCITVTARTLRPAPSGPQRKGWNPVYKYLLCWRYLLTRYLALACIISVMLGVATLIVVNSVMSGFSTKLKSRLHGLLSDIVVESWEFDGFPDPDEK